MFNRTFLGLGAAAFIAAGSIGATSGVASARYDEGPGIYLSVGPSHHRGHKVCKPIYKKVRWYDKWGRPHVRVKIIDYRCWWEHRRHHHDDYQDRGDYEHYDNNYDNGRDDGYGGWDRPRCWLPEGC